MRFLRAQGLPDAATAGRVPRPVAGLDGQPDLAALVEAFAGG